jgi:hypothetical protein
MQKLCLICEHYDNENRYFTQNKVGIRQQDSSLNALAIIGVAHNIVDVVIYLILWVWARLRQNMQSSMLKIPPLYCENHLTLRIL